MAASTQLKASPVRWLGAPAPGGLALPDASPTSRHCYAPRHVYLDDRVLVVSDSGNHRVLIWHGLPTRDHQPADVVLGQPDFETEGPGLLHLPTGVGVCQGRLYVADAWHHRLLIWKRVPQVNAEPPAYVVGQPDFAQTLPNRGGAIGPLGFYWPYGAGPVGDWFYVADTGNRRILVWRGLPEAGEPPQLVLGQADFTAGLENRGQPVAADSFRWPHAVAGDRDHLYVADAGNHRVLGYCPLPTRDRPADLVLGQRAFNDTRELPHVPQGAHALRSPYGASWADGRLAVADTANNRIVIFRDLPPKGEGVPAADVIGQANFDDSGENQWQAVRADTLCWPYGICLHGDLLAVADSGNNRVMLWRVPRAM